MVENVEKKWRNFSHFFKRVFFLENYKLMFMIYIFLILRTLKQHGLNLKNSYKFFKTLIQYNFLIPSNKKGFLL